MDRVKIKEIKKHCDDRGFFAELLRDDDNWLDKFGQLSMTITYPGIIKAFHKHEFQDDVWFVASGMARVALVQTDPKREHIDQEHKTIFMGEDNPIILFIPNGIWHGYQVMGNKPITLFYLTNNSYNKEHPDELRRPYDYWGKHMWEIKNR